MIIRAVPWKKFRKNLEKVSQCRKCVIPYLYALKRAIAYAYTLQIAIVYLNTWANYTIS